jgi:hypothetical protein
MLNVVFHTLRHYPFGITNTCRKAGSMRGENYLLPEDSLETDVGEGVYELGHAQDV